MVKNDTRTPRVETKGWVLVAKSGELASDRIKDTYDY